MGKVQDLLDRAKRDTRKGDYRVYQEYKEDLILLKPTREQYEATMKLIATALRV